MCFYYISNSDFQSDSPSQESTIFTPTLIALILCVTLTLINSLLSKQRIFDREKTSPFECGFDPKTKSRLPFSLRFYLIALVFLIFDVEITLILPMPVIFQ